MAWISIGDYAKGRLATVAREGQSIQGNSLSNVKSVAACEVVPSKANLWRTPGRVKGFPVMSRGEHVFGL